MFLVFLPLISDSISMNVCMYGVSDTLSGLPKCRGDGLPQATGREKLKI